MLSKLNSTISKVYENSAKGIRQTLKTPINIKPLKTKNISIIKSTTPSFNKWLIRIKEFYNRHRADFKYLLLAIPIIATFLIVREVQKYQSLHSEAISHQAAVYIQPASWNLPPEGSFDVWINAGSNVGFTHLEMTFNPSLVTLTNEITTYPALSRVVKVSTRSEANSTGKISIVLAPDPNQRNSPPSGTFRVATLSLDTNTPYSVSTSVNFDSSKTSIVAMDQSVFITTFTGLNLNLNPTPIPTPTATPTSTEPPIITPTPTANPDITPPTITINNPPDGYTLPFRGTVKINTSASDASGIYSIQIFIDETSKKLCSNTTSCVYNLNVKNVTAGTHTIRVEAKDKSPNRNTTFTSITVTK